MTATHTRPLAYRVHARFPATPADQREWAVEMALALASDYDEPGLLEVARITAGWTPEQWTDRVGLLLDLSDECAEAELIGYGPRLHVADREYRLVLGELATGADFDRHARSAIAVVDELAEKRGQR
jgi:hypothetical protein